MSGEDGEGSRGGGGGAGDRRGCYDDVLTLSTSSGMGGFTRLRVEREQELSGGYSIDGQTDHPARHGLGRACPLAKPPAGTTQ